MNFGIRYEIENDPQPEDVGVIRITATISDESDDPLTFVTESLAKDDLRRSQRRLYIFLQDAGIDDDDIGSVNMDLLNVVVQVTCSASNEYTPGCALNIWIDIPKEYNGRDAEIDEDYNDGAEIDEDYNDGAEIVVDYYNDAEIDADYYNDAEIDVDYYDDVEIDEGYYDDAEIDEAVQTSFDETNNIRFRPASKQVVKSLTRKIYNKKIQKKHKKTKNYKDISLEECAICLEDFSEGGKVVTLPCGHDFDDECIVKWLETSHICPLCRFELPCEDQWTTVVLPQN